MIELTMMAILFVAAVVACMSAFIVLLLGRLGVRDYVVMYGTRLLSALFSCDFCMCFWTVVAITTILVVALHSPALLLAIPISTPIARILL